MSMNLFADSPCSGEGRSVGGPVYRRPGLRPLPEHKDGEK